MLRNTFSHIPGVTANTESTIWRSNVWDWGGFLDKHNGVPIQENKKQRIVRFINKSIEAYENMDHNFFLSNMPGNLHWRAYPDMKCCFLDIETTGLSRHYDDLTVIGLFDGKQSSFFVKGQNLDEFRDQIRKYNMLVTYNGKCFDVPFLKAKFPEVDFNKMHVDLRFAMKELGYSGGLKNIERMMGINRDEDLQGMDGFEAVRLWHRYVKGDEAALDVLLRYNKADIENLKTLMDMTFKKLREKHFLSVINQNI
ncbi:ribonuclease H-like domain-containing protein [Candidatus Woesearchaeota archaeon]|nr:ribonuclease H-like domain-containing protein [Candidatus Woesearchaeota archaeon]MBW3021815.1 ribonuclease H-like domain-containing protein [Candidatus Woesearchaeota archaeon]